jgi:5-dehydro-2-deoxygluconokinase
MQGRNGFSIACTVEKSGQEEFDFEYGEELARHIEPFNPTFAKVLVRYNPEGDSALNQHQTSRLKRLSDYLHGSGRMLMFELLVPPTKTQLDRLKGDQKTYDCELRPDLMMQAICQLQDCGVEPDVWKIEGMNAAKAVKGLYPQLDGTVGLKVGYIVLGRGEDDAKVREWLVVAASAPGFIGFAVGRTSFWEPLMNWRAKRTTRDEAVAGLPGAIGSGLGSLSVITPGFGLLADGKPGSTEADTTDSLACNKPAVRFTTEDASNT